MTEYEFHKEAAEILENIDCTQDDINTISQIESDDDKIMEIKVDDNEIPIPFSEQVKNAIIYTLQETVEKEKNNLSTLKASYKQRL